MRGFGCIIWTFLFQVALISTSSPGSDAPAADKPLFREFMGLCGHTIQFKPVLYAGLPGGARLSPVRMGRRQRYELLAPFPSARNGVDWGQVYGDWKAAGYETEVSLMFHNVPAKAWKDLPRDATAYGRAFAKAFGPSSKLNLVAAAEIGNEPGHYDDESYRSLFQNMATGLRTGDPKLKVGTCAPTLDESGKYAKSVKCVQGLEKLYDFLNIHTYAEVEGYPTWRRSYPEDPKLDYLRRVEQLIAWRDQRAPARRFA